MKIEKLNEYITKTEEKIAKKEATIEKKQTKIEKLQKKVTVTQTLEELTWIPSEERTAEMNDQIDILFDISGLEGDIERAKKEIANLNQKLDEYKAKRAAEIAKEAEVPEVLRILMNHIVEENDKADAEYQEELKAEYREIGYKPFVQKYKAAKYDFLWKSKEAIHEDNVNYAKALVFDLINRTKETIGSITSWDNITITRGTHGIPALNGYVEGEKGKAVLESIYAGGYNIQRLHIRVLVKKI
jgi:chromosome segregation ATPase